MKYLFLALPLALVGCTPPAPLPPASALTRAADPAFSMPPPAGPSLDYTARAIAEPMDWRQLNDAQAPGGGS